MKKQFFVKLVLLIMITMFSLGVYAQEKVELNFAVDTGAGGRVLTQAARDFERLYGDDLGVTINVMAYPGWEVRDKQLLDLAMKAGTIDIISLEAAWMGLLGPYVEPLEDFIQKDENFSVDKFIPALLDGFKFTDIQTNDVTQVALPIRVGGWIMHYREDLLKKHNLEVPHTLDELVHVAQTVTNDSDDVYGLTLALRKGNFLAVQWHGLFWSAGGQILDLEQRKVMLDDERSIEATQFIVDLYRELGVVTPESIDYEHDGLITAMQQGDAAIAVTFSPYASLFDDPEQSQCAGNIGWSSPPYNPKYVDGPRTYVSGWGLAMNSASDHKDIVWEFIKFATSEEEQLKLALEEGNTPTLLDLYNNAEYQKIFPAAETSLEAFQNGIWAPSSVPGYTRIEETITLEVSNALIGTKTVEQAMNDAAREIEKILNW